MRLLAALLMILSAGPAVAQGSVNVYNWSDYIAEDQLKDFAKATGIKVNYTTYDSNEILDAKLKTGKSGYDVVVPTASPFFVRQLQANLFTPLDRSKLKNWGNLDPEIMAALAKYDPGNAHAIPWMWGTTGLGYNVAEIKKRMPDAPVDSLDMVFNPDVVKNFADCGVTMLDAPAEIIPIAMNYLKIDPKSTDPDDLAKVEALLTKVRPYIRYFHSSKYINDLANGDICVTLGWSGDILQARTRAAAAANKREIAYSIPREGTLINFDTMAIPKDAPHPQNGHAWIDFNMRPDIAAANSSYISFANPIPESLPLVDPLVAKDPGVFPPAEVKAKLFALSPADAKQLRLQNRLWTRVVTGQ